MSDEATRYTEALQRFSGDLRMSQQVFNSMVDRGIEVQPIHRQLLLQAYLAARDLEGARRLIAEMTAAGHPPDPSIRWDMAITAARGGRTDAALAALDELHDEGSAPDAGRAPAVLSIYIAAGRFPAARAVLRGMASRDQRATDAEYVQLLRDCLDRRAIKDTRSIIDLMIMAGASPNPRLASDLVTMVARAGHTDRAIELLDRLTSAGVALPGEVLTERRLALPQHRRHRPQRALG
ncbi:MAG: hypothetical protein WD010_00455, partial [Nitriliruptor sp.]